MLYRTKVALDSENKEHINTVWEKFTIFKRVQKIAMFSYLSVRPHETTRFPLDGFSWNLIFEYFSKICRENSSFLEI
jgi:hypothetical protein